MTEVDEKLLTHTVHVWYIYLHEWLFAMENVGKYTMDPIGNLFTKPGTFLLC